MHPTHILKLMGRRQKYINIFSCPAGRVTYNVHLFYKHMHLSFKRVSNKEHEGVICMTSSSNSFQKLGRITCPLSLISRVQHTKP